jgi:hypothetical protein
MRRFVRSGDFEERGVLIGETGGRVYLGKEEILRGEDRRIARFPLLKWRSSS